MDLAELLDKYKTGRRVRENRRSYEPPATARHGTIEGTSLGGMTKRNGNHFTLNIHVKWDDGTESTSISPSSLELLDEPLSTENQCRTERAGDGQRCFLQAGHTTRHDYGGFA